MLKVVKKLLYTCLLFLSFIRLQAQSPLPGYEFVSNQGQWTEPFLYKTALPGGELFLEKDRLVYTFWDNEKKGAVMEALHDHGGTAVTDGKVPAHGMYIRFNNSRPSVQVTGEDAASHYYNYFQSPDPQRWKGKVPVYRKVNYQGLYNGIDLHFYTSSQYLKYDFVVAPGADPGQISMRYEGAESIRLSEGMLQVKTSVNEWTEQKPYAYQLIGGEKKEVECAFRLRRDEVSFELGSYDRNYPLVIDPILIFATYSGSVRDNWGFTATYDYNDNMYGGGIVFGPNTYPGTTGSFQLNFGGGDYDALICKFNSTGNTLLYYTYLGGALADAPCSMVCNSQNQLYILGVTGSSGFPVTAGAYQNTFGGGPSTGIFTTGIGNDFAAGSDIFVSKLSEDGSTLLGSTFVGGTGLDGINLNSLLTHNYADEFRGEIIVDNSDQCYIASSTSSPDFPVLNPAQGSLSGTQDAVVCKFNSNLSAAQFSTYLGGSGAEGGYSLQRNTSGDIYVTGGTTSSNFPTTGGVIHPSAMGGVDGFLTRLSAGGNTILSSTYLGTGSYDQSYAVQLDGNEDVFVVGQTTGPYPVTGGVYSNPNSGQFIHKLNPGLSTTGFSTVFGRGIPGQIDIVPTAFLVDVCDHIYVAGWGGNVNSGSGGGSTFGLPVTANAHQSGTDGSDFYLFVLDNNATGLLYATYFGGSVSDEHVDGGTSRFDKNGIVYEAVCAGCGGNSDFPTTPGAWSNSNNANNCNLGVFKFDVSDFTAIIDPLTPTTICANGSVTLNNASTGGFPHVWDFGDGSPTSTAQTVTHTYTQPGTYVVYLTVTAPNACITSDIDSIVITVEGPPDLQIQAIGPICPDSVIQLVATGGDTYQWDFSLYLSSLTIPNPLAAPPSTQDFYLTAFNDCGSDRDTITVTVINFQLTVSEDDTICSGNSIQLSASGGTAYLWNNAASLDDNTVANPVATPTASTEYIVEVTDVNGCRQKDTVFIQVDNFPLANAGPDQTLCLGDEYTFNATGGAWYSWFPPTYLNNAAISNPVTHPLQTITYIMSASNTCGTDNDTVTVHVIVVNAYAGPDTIICPGTSAMLTATGGATYHWEPEPLVDDPDRQTVTATPVAPTNFIVLVTDTNGCTDRDTVFVNMFPAQVIDLGPDVLLPFGDSYQLHANGDGTFSWDPVLFLSCSDCPDPVASPPYSMQYIVTVTDSNGCAFQDSINIFIEGSLYIPNTFTPNGDDINDLFRAYGIDIAEFTMRIFNRWGEEIFVTEDLHHGWDGTYRSSKCPLGVYVWKVDYMEISGKGGQLIGHVNLLR